MKIIEVTTKKQLKQFIQFGTDLYLDCKYACPPLFKDEYDTLCSETNPAFEVCEAVYYMAVDDSGKILGRIAGIVNHRANSHWNVKKVRFGWFDFIDDLAISKALLDAVAEWGKSKGMDTLNGPVGFSDMDKEGLLVEGFEGDQLMSASYNYEYYIKHYEAYGFTEESSWHERKLIVPDSVPERLLRVAAISRERCHLRRLEINSTKEVMKTIGYKFFDLIDDCYSGLYNYSPLTRRQKEYYSSIYFPILNYDLVTIVVNEKDELVGIGITMPNITEVLRKTKGKLFPFGWYHILKKFKAKEHDEVDLLLIAVRPDYQGKGVNAIFFEHQLPNFFKYKAKYANVTNILDTNDKSIANWEYFETAYMKARKAYVKEIRNEK